MNIGAMACYILGYDYRGVIPLAFLGEEEWTAAERLRVSLAEKLANLDLPDWSNAELFKVLKEAIQEHGISSDQCIDAYVTALSDHYHHYWHRRRRPSA